MVVFALTVKAMEAGSSVNLSAKNMFMKCIVPQYIAVIVLETNELWAYIIEARCAHGNTDHAGCQYITKSCKA